MTTVILLTAVLIAALHLAAALALNPTDSLRHRKGTLTPP